MGEGGNASNQRPFPWIWVTLAAGLMVLGGLWLVNVPMAPDPVALQGRGVEGDKLGLRRFTEAADGSRVAEQLKLRDPTPLYLPTEWNSGVVQPSMALETAPGTSFESIQPKYFFDPADTGLRFSETMSVPDSAIQTVDRFMTTNGYHEFSRTQIPAVPLQDRAGLVEISRAGDGRKVLREELVGEPIFATLAAPIEMLVAIDSAGRVGQPAITSSSGDATTDSRGMEILLDAKPLGALLDPGIYRILLGP